MIKKLVGNLKITQIIVMLFAVLFLSSCTSQTIQPSVAHSQNAANIIITRPSSLWGSAFSAPIYVNNIQIGRLGNGGTVNWSVQPGKVIVSTSEGIAAVKFQQNKASAISFNAAKGKTYYVNVTSPYQASLVSPAFDVELINK